MFQQAPAILDEFDIESHASFGMLFHADILFSTVFFFSRLTYLMKSFYNYTSLLPMEI